MKIEEVAAIIEKISPLETQEPWDNSGFQIRLGNPEISRVLVAMEITDKVIDEAILMEADAIVTHHPMFFGSFNKIDDKNVTGNYAVKLIENRISVYATHTPFDKCKGGNNDYLANLLNLWDIQAMSTDSSGFCRVGTVDGECTAAEYIEHVCSKLKLDRRRISFVGNTGDFVGKVGLCTGAGADFIENAAAEGCDLFITGDVKYHGAQLAKELGLNVLDIGHYGSEKIFVKNVAGYLRSHTDIDIEESQVSLEPFVIF